MSKLSATGDGREWLDHLPCAVTVCDRRYKIVYMNEKSAEVNSKDGGMALIGKNLMDCHPPEAQEKLKKVMESADPHIYIVRRKGSRKMVFQSRWMKNGRAAGLVEFYFALPPRVPVMKRT